MQTICSHCFHHSYLRRLGNKAFAAKDYDEAIKHYTAAIAIDSKNCVYYSNRR